MFIEKVIIEGFKSYATRTEFSGFDRYFNAITGLNGSGKSNSLDAICFCLGISNLSQVRVAKLDELVYKHGQAGITKASVSIVFNNEDRKNSPVGYEQYDKITVTRQIVIGGRNKYFINGKNAQLIRVQNLFHSVRLNVNNPHFLIMQGRISKVLNMKPPEILGMIEEAAGTRMFEVKKKSALRTIELKDKKMQEYSDILDKEITPTLERLRKEKDQYMKWTSNKSEYDRLKKISIAFEFTSSLKKVTESENIVKQMETEKKQLNDKIKENEDQISLKKTEIQKLNTTKDKKLGGKYKQLEESVTTLSNELVRISTMIQHSKDSQKSETKTLDSLRQSKKETQKMIEKMKNEIEKAREDLAKATENYDKLQQQLEELQLKISINVKVSDPKKDSKSRKTAKTLDEKLDYCKQEISRIETQIQEIQLQSEHLKNEHSKLKPKMKESEREFNKLQELHKHKQEDLQKLEKQASQLGFDADSLQRLRNELVEKQEMMRKLNQEKYQLSRQLSTIEFIYQDPTPNFDRSKVKGIFASLVEIHDPEKYTTALEVYAGGKLYNVVVDSADTGQLLIDNGKLKQRVTIIPLDKIYNQTLPKTTVKNAEKKVGRSSVSTALSLIGFPEEIRAAVNYVFGNVLVCTNIETARSITFDPQIHVKTVTLDGDVLDPVGTMTGGSQIKKTSILKSLQVLNKINNSLETLANEIQKISADLGSLEDKHHEYQQIMREMELQKHEITLLENQDKQSRHYQIFTSAKNIEKEIEDLKHKLQTLNSDKKNAVQEAERLASEIKEFANADEEQIKKTEKEIAKQKKLVSSAEHTVQKRQQVVEQLLLEQQEYQNELAKTEQQISSSNSKLSKISEEIVKQNQEATEKEKELETQRSHLEEYRQKQSEANRTLKLLMQERDAFAKSISDCEVEMKRIEHKFTRFQKDRTNAQKFVEEMERTHSWIKKEKKYFGKVHTDYDFANMDFGNITTRLEEISKEQETLERSLNKKVMSMYEKAEADYQGLIEKREIVQRDRSNIERVIQKLNEEKDKAIKETWQQVNKNFGSIFATLLPGTSAKLVPIDPESLQSGLEITVAFGDVWKESLTELSGGQRSLLALSLILSLLLFKPAPVYILDEIDAALDPSHTQNIGKMLKTHFAHSQFIVVSLKEGMFNNANVVFRTKFVDGKSVVTRTIPQKKNISHKKEIDYLNENQNQNQNENIDNSNENENENENIDNEIEKEKEKNNKNKKKKITKKTTKRRHNKKKGKDL
ncbi:structural maintenance of chromosomes protein [Anaeramoeba ignava]|uniref:Structural maintenance of chromosomes protein n=1 Tax=Anaeramoeba ignava TaxID=1746090 RepID=A0A9Q0R8R0_ANAIG|nr:structural maintenance of chromosomes protein [Anaeramoeba ignava]